MILQSSAASQLSQWLHTREIAGALAQGVTWLVGLILPADAAARLVASVQLEVLARVAVSTAIFIGGLFALFFVLEYFHGGTRTVYRSRVFAQDVVYTLFYHGGFYKMLIWSGLANLLHSRLAFLQIDALAMLPGPVHWVLYWVVTDFLYYWIHRWQHAWAPLWAIHSVHHSQEQMTFASTFRFHPLDFLTNDLLSVLPLMVLGVPTFSWLPLYVGMQVFDAAQHTSLNWGFGRAYRVFVSPRFHAYHHSADPEHHNRNFSKIFSVWDFVFGTAIEAECRPERFGVEGMPVPRTMWQQLMVPFVALLRRPRAASSAANTAAPVPEPRSVS